MYQGIFRCLFYSGEWTHMPPHKWRFKYKSTIQASSKNYLQYWSFIGIPSIWRIFICLAERTEPANSPAPPNVPSWPALPTAPGAPSPCRATTWSSLSLAVDVSNPWHHADQFLLDFLNGYLPQLRNSHLLLMIWLSLLHQRSWMEWITWLRNMYCSSFWGKIDIKSKNMKFEIVRMLSWCGPV